MADQYCLRWNNHLPNFISVFKNLLELEELVDVTLSVEGKHIKAHKVILSACSPYFKLLFTMTPCKHPVIILSDVKYMDLRVILDFMYCGEVNVTDSQLADILEVAESLQVRGLCDPSKITGNLSSEKSRESKKRKRQWETIDANNVPQVSQADVIPQQRFEQVNTSDAGSDGGMFDPTDWLNVHGQSFNDDVTVSRECHPDISPQDCEVTPNISIQENMNGIEVFDNSLPNIPSHMTRPVTSSTPVRRRNSKVQESKNFLLALEAVRSGSLGFCKAAKIYGLNNRTLWLEYKKRGYPATRPPVGLKHKTNTLSSSPS